MSEARSIPRLPDRPLPEECCGRGCCPCIMDYYEDAMERWRKVVTEAGFDPDVVLAREAG